MAKSVLWYGESGAFKSTQVIYLARYIYKKTGKILRVISTDSSSGGMFDPYVKAGLMEVWRVSSLENPLPVVRRLTKGYWPQVQTINGVNKLVMTAPSAETWKRVGGVVLDSLTTIGDIVMRDVVDKGRKIAEDVVSEFSEGVTIITERADGKADLGKEEMEKFGAPARAHYNFIQNMSYGIVNALSSLPVEVVGFTCLEAKTEEEDRTTIYGPSILGKKATPKVPSWVGDCLHFDSYQAAKIIKGTGTDGKLKDETIYETKVRAYFVRHPDPKSGINHPAKPRVPPEKFGELLKRWPGGYFEPTLEQGLDMFLEFEDQLAEGTANDLTKWREDIDKKMGRTK